MFPQIGENGQTIEMQHAVSLAEFVAQKDTELWH